jgi:hypothetical protein
MTTAAEKREPRQHFVRINIDDKGFAYDAPGHQNAREIVVRNGDTIRWNCGHGNYTVLFKAGSPFRGKAVAVHGPKNTDTMEAVIEGIKGHHYAYAVTVALEGSGLIVDDPVIIIDGD